MIPVVLIVGRSNSGKTTLIEKLIDEFNSLNIPVSVIKHTHHNFQMDYEGKDTYRFREAGAKSVIISNDKKIGVISDQGVPLEPDEIIHQYVEKSTGLVFIEGFKGFEGPMIEVIGDSEEEPLFLDRGENFKAIVSDRKLQTGLPVFRRDDVKGIAEFINREFIVK